MQARTDAQLKRGIGEFYDESSGIWEEVWGEHMHHGYYREGEKPASFARHVEAQDDMIEKALELCGADGVAARCRRDGRRLRVLDVGCGVGGSSRYIARKYGADVVGLTLSEASGAGQRALAGPERHPEGRGRDEHGLRRRLLRPGVVPGERRAHARQAQVRRGARAALRTGRRRQLRGARRLRRRRPSAPASCSMPTQVTWCHRDLEPDKRLGRVERAVLGAINYCYYLPKWCSGADYRSLFGKQPGFASSKIVVEDWTRNIAPFWPAVFRSALRWRSLRGLMRTGIRTARGAVAILLMIVGYRIGTVKFVAVAANREFS